MRYRYRFFPLIREFSCAWFKSRDQAAVLGLLWSFLNPVLCTTVLFLLFRSRFSIAAGRDGFFYILVGMVVWSFLENTISSSLGVLVSRAEMVRNVAFPKEVLVYSQVAVCLMHHCLELALLCLTVLLLGVQPSWHWALLPLIVLIALPLLVGIGLILSCLFVVIRDTGHLVRIFLRLAFFAMPIFYQPGSLSSWARPVVVFNPLSQVLEFYRGAVLYQRAPGWLPMLLVALLSAAVFFAGRRFFRACEFSVVERV